MTDRRYDADEVAEIFRRATEAQQGAAQNLPVAGGMTLAELRDIGKDVGLPADLVADAARSLDRHEPRFRRQFLGMTVGVGRTVALERRLTDEEWERLVPVLRETFEARGNFRVDGSLRQWTNGNLQILIEPTETGDRVRMRTVHQGARGMMVLGAGVLATVGLVAVATASMGLGGVGEQLASLVPLAAVGAGALVFGALRIRGWAATRLRQMDEIARRLTSSTSGDRLDE
ncbi:MAG: hypothetical protein ABI442_01345 [Gemmatimonadaceae bacterium]